MDGGYKYPGHGYTKPWDPNEKGTTVPAKSLMTPAHAGKSALKSLKKTFKQIRKEGVSGVNEHVNVGNHPPHTYLDKPHLVRLNTILTQITSKLFLNIHVFTEAVRAALDFHGIKLDHLDVEQQTHGPNLGHAYGDLAHGPGFEDNRNVQGVPNEFEYVFELKYEDITGGEEPQEYLYMCGNQVEIDGAHYWETYAQVVDAEELEDLLSMEEDPRHFREPVGDASGETEYLKLQRHTNVSGTSPEVENE